MKPFQPKGDKADRPARSGGYTRSKDSFHREDSRSFDRENSASSGFMKDKRPRVGRPTGDSNSEHSAPKRRSFNPNFTSDNRPAYGRNSERGDRFNRSDRADRFERSERPDRSERPEGGFERNNRFDRNERGDRNSNFSDRPRKAWGERGGGRPSKPWNKESGERSFSKPWNKEGSERSFSKPWNKEGSERSFSKPWNKEGRSDDSRKSSWGGERGERGDRPSKPWNKEGGERSFSKPWNKEGGERSFSKPWNKEGGDRSFSKPWNKEGRSDDSRKGSWGNKPDRFEKKQQEYPRFEPSKSTGEVRLNRFIANSGICSRREADDLITAGVVTVNGEVVTELGSKVRSSDEVRFNGELMRGEKKVYLVMNKPKGYVTSVDDPHHQDKTVMDLLRGACSERVYPVGRLDRNTLGVLLITNDGELTSKLTHPSYGKRKVYQATLDKPLTQADMLRITEGVELEDGVMFVDEVSYVGDSKRDIGLEIHSGRNRVVRRLFEALGYNVQKLDRVYFAGLTKKNLKRGAFRFLTPIEVARLMSGEYE